MYCKECGQQIADDSKFCNFCGGKQIEDKIDVQKTKESGWGPIIISITLLLIGVAVFFTVVALEDLSTGGNKINNIFASINAERKATNNDISVNFTSTTYYSKADEYKIKLQANEKIRDLVIELDFLDKNGKILKTEILEIGSVTPGNQYSYKLSQNGISPDDVDKTTNFNIRVKSGYIVE